MCREINIKIQFGEKTLLSILALFFLCFNPKILGSETLTLTTYYPSPYGGYAKLLTTNKTILARDGTVSAGSSVGIGTASPTQKLDVSASNINNANIRARNNIYWGSKYPNKGKLTSDQGSSIELGGEGTPYIDFSNDTGSDYDARIILMNDDSLRFDGTRVGIGRTPSYPLDISGDVRINRTGASGTLRGRLLGLCTLRTYIFGGSTSCGTDERVIAYYGDGANTVSGFLPSSRTTYNTAGTAPPGKYVQLGYDWSGTMLCCRIQ